MSFTVEQLHPKIYKVVEDDRFGQYPFLYVIIGSDKCILIDTGCGVANYREFVTNNINRQNLPYYVINTHVHFDHIGGNNSFSNCPICMGNNNTTFTNNYEINSLAAAHSGAQIKSFKVTNWLSEGDIIYLDDKSQNKDEALHVLFTPGHTPDSIALYAPFDRRIFVGDTIYPYTVIHLDCIGSNLADFMKSLKKLDTFIKKIESEPIDNKTSDSTTPTETKSIEQKTEPVPSQQDPHQQEKEKFLFLLGMETPNFNLDNLLELSGYSAETAVDMYLTNSDDVIQMCGPYVPPKVSSTPTFNSSVETSKSAKVRLSCGHVEANLGSESVGKLIDMLTFIGFSALPPVSVDGEYTEYSTETFTLMLKTKDIPQLNS